MFHSSSLRDDSRHPPTLQNTSLSNLVNSDFSDERCIFWTTTFIFWTNRCSWPGKKRRCDLRVSEYTAQ